MVAASIYYNSFCLQSGMKKVSYFDLEARPVPNRRICHYNLMAPKPTMFQVLRAVQTLVNEGQLANEVSVYLLASRPDYVLAHMLNCNKCLATEVINLSVIDILYFYHINHNKKTKCTTDFIKKECARPHD